MRIVPHFKTNGKEEIYKRVYVDFKISNNRLLVKPNTNIRGAIWDEAIWDKDFWTIEDVIFNYRASTQSNVGNFISVGIYGRTKTPISIYSIGVLYKQSKGAHI
jgi:hypothetical protein